MPKKKVSKHAEKRGMSDKEAKAAMRKKALGIACVLLLGLLPPVAAQQPVDPTLITKFTRNMNTVVDPLGSKLYGFVFYTQECFLIPTDNDGTPSFGEVRTFIPWTVQGADTVGYRARYCKVTAKKGDGIFIRPFGQGNFTNLTGSSTDQQISASSDSTASEYTISTEVDSLWIWDTIGTGNVCVFCF